MGNVTSNAERQARIRERRKAVKDRLTKKAAVKGWKKIDVLVFVKNAESPFAEPGDTEVMLFSLDGKLLLEHGIKLADSSST